MKRLIYSLLLFVGFASQAQITNNVPWYKYTNLLEVGKFKMTSEGEYATSFTLDAVTASVTLDTIAADRTVTFSNGLSSDKGVIIKVYNANNSAFVWNVAGNVIEGNGTVISTLPRGLYEFYWNGTKWVRTSTGSSSSPTIDTLTFSSPLVQLDKNVSLDFDAFPQDTVGVVEHNDSLFNILYSHTGVRDSTFIVLLTAGGGTPGGSNKQIQYNNSGSFGGEALFEYDASTNTLTADTAYFQRIKANWDALGFDGSKDTTLSFDRITGQVIKNIGAGDNAFDGDRKIKIFAGILRPTIPALVGDPIVWDWLYPASSHDTVGFSAPITVSGSNMTIYYRTMNSVLFFTPTEDDEFKKNRVAIGASVGVSNANLSFTIQTNVAGYVRGNGSIWVLSGPLASSIDWAYTSGKFEYKYKTGVTTADRESAVAHYEGTNGYTIKRNLSGISGSYTGSWSLADQFGNTASITPQTTDIVTMYTGGTYNASVSIQNRHATNSDPYITSGSAVFVMGIFQDLADPNRLYGSITTSSVTTTSMTLTWPANSSGAGTYTLERATTQNFSSPTTIYTGSALTFGDTGLTTGTTYYYRVRHSRTSDAALSDMLYKAQATL